MSIDLTSSKLVSSSLSIPLYPNDEDFLYDAIMDVINGTQVPDPHVNARRGMLVIAAVISGATKYFFIPASMKLPAGPLWAGCNCVGWFFLEFGFAYQFIQNIMSPTLESEDRLLAYCRLRTCSKVAIAIPSFILGVLSQLTAALQAVKYNPASSKIVVAGITGTSTGFYPAVSMQETMVATYESARNRYNPPTPFECKLMGLRADMLQLIGENHMYFSSLNRWEKIAQAGKFHSARTNLSDDEKYTQYMRLMLTVLQKRFTQPKQDTTCDKVSLIVKKGLALFFTATAEVCGSMYTVYYAKESFNYNNDNFARGMSALYAGAGLYVTWKLNDWMMHYIGSTLSGNREKSAAEQLYPWTTHALIGLTFIVDFFSQGSVWQIWEDFSQEKGYIDTQLFFQITQCAGTFLILFASTLGTIKVGLAYYNQTRGSHTDQQILALDREFQKLSLLLEKSSFLHLAIHLSKFPESLKKEILDTLLDTHKITAGELRTYIDAKFGRGEESVPALRGDGKEEVK